MLPLQESGLVYTKNDLRKAVLLVSPTIIVIAVFVYGFIAWSLRVSFSAWDGIKPDFSFVWFKNYIRLFQNTRFQIDLLNTFYFTILFILVCVVFGFILAYLLNRNIKGEGIFRTVFMFPLALSFVVTGVLWRWILNPTVGVNSLFALLGIKNAVFGWYTNTESIAGFNIALLSVILAASWQYLGYTMAMFLAGLRGIPLQLIESAQIEGAGELRIIRSIVLPSIKPIILSAIIVLGHISLKIFDLVYAMTGQGPAFVTDFPGLFMFETTFRGNHYAEGAAVSIVMLIMVALVIVPYLYSTFKKEN